MSLRAEQFSNERGGSMNQRRRDSTGEKKILEYHGREYKQQVTRNKRMV